MRGVLQRLGITFGGGVLIALFVWVCHAVLLHTLSPQPPGLGGWVVTTMCGIIVAILVGVIVAGLITLVGWIATGD